MTHSQTVQIYRQNVWPTYCGQIWLNTNQTITSIQQPLLGPGNGRSRRLEPIKLAIRGNFVNPPFCLLPKVIHHICASKSEATLIAPFWPTKTWFYKLKRIAVCPPLRLPKPTNMCIGHLDTVPEPLKNPKWKLYA